MILADQYLVPNSLTEALEIAEQYRDSHLLIMGATDLIPNSRETRRGDIREQVVIDLSRVPELRSIDRQGPRIQMGSGVTFGDFLQHSLLRQEAPLLGQCAFLVGDDQIRHEASIGGNIVNASPAADGTVCLLALGATVTLEALAVGQRHTRVVPLGDFVLGPGQTGKRPGEILTAVTCDATGVGYGTAFRKIGHRRSLIIAVASTACVVRLDDDGTMAEVRLAVGAVSAVPNRLPECESLLEGRRPTPDLFRTVGELARDRVASRTRIEYRRDVVASFVQEALSEAVERAATGSLGFYKEVQHG